jgi:hypothetical protein
MFDLIGRQDPPPITHPAFYYGFVGAGLAWQLVFFTVATNPARFRPLMIVCMVEKFSYATALIVLYVQGRLHRADLVLAGVDFVLGILFLASFLKTQPDLQS